MISDFHNTVIVTKNIYELLLQNLRVEIQLHLFGNNTQNSSV